MRGPWSKPFARINDTLEECNCLAVSAHALARQFPPLPVVLFNSIICSKPRLTGWTMHPFRCFGIGDITTPRTVWDDNKNEAASFVIRTRYFHDVFTQWERPRRGFIMSFRPRDQNDSGSITRTPTYGRCYSSCFRKSRSKQLKIRLSRFPVGVPSTRMLPP